MDARAGGEVYRGQLGQTSKTSIQVSERDGSVFPATIYAAINVTRDPELRDEFFSGALFEVESAVGDGPHRLAAALRYHDEELRLFALVVPAELRHREFELRASLLADLAGEDEAIPAYVRNFETVFGPEHLTEVEEAYRRPTEASTAPETPPAEPAGAEPSTPHDSAELDEAWEKIEAEREELERERDQLGQVSARIERERERMDEVERELADERASLEDLRSEIEAMKLNLEQQQLRAEQGAPASNAEESTQVVTDDQFIEVLEDGGSPIEDVSEAVEEVDADEPYIERISGADLPESFDAHAAGPADQYVAVLDGQVVAAARVPARVLEALESADSDFFVQYVEAGDYPLAGLLLTALDDDQQEVESVGWPLDVTDSDDELVLDRLTEALRLHAALYDEDGELAAVYAIRAPLETNLAWIRERAERQLTRPGVEIGSFADAVESWAARDNERLGQMRHNFHARSFADAQSPAELKLAAGIVGYWSTPEKFEYLVAHRSFPLERFEEMQERVVRGAIRQGIFLNEPLRQVAFDLGIAADGVALAERLVAEFAEVSVGIHPNDLDPLEEWENWELLVDYAQDVGVSLDPEVLEVAEGSLKRAQDYQETGLPQSSESDAPAESAESGEPAKGGHDEYEVDDLVVARQSESTGVTYFLPDDAVLDTFDDLASMAREDLELLLDDPKGRLEASQMLVERFGASATQKVLEGAENMTAAEVAALARFMETKAEGLEAELVRCVESGGPSATFVATRALVGIRSTSAIPVLVDAYRDSDRRGDKETLARVLADYGPKLLPVLKRVIKKDGADKHIVRLLCEMERQHDGVLAKLAKDRSQSLRTAAEKAREKL